MLDEETKVVVKSQASHKTHQTNLTVLWVCLFGLIVADGLITEYLIAGRLGWELNPLLAILVGDSSFLIFKALGAALAILILRNVARSSYRVSLAFTYCSVLLYSVIVFWNLIVFYLGLPRILS